jgi:hypothetical protein
MYMAKILFDLSYIHDGVKCFIADICNYKLSYISITTKISTL